MQKKSAKELPDSSNNSGYNDSMETTREKLEGFAKSLEGLLSEEDIRFSTDSISTGRQIGIWFTTTLIGGFEETKWALIQTRFHKDCFELIENPGDVTARCFISPIPNVVFAVIVQGF